jgi:hypothetical protein
MTRDMVEREYTSHLRASNDADGMVEAGVVDGALDLYAQRGEWDRVFEVAGKDSGESLSRYAPAYITASLEKGRAADVVAMFTRYGAPCIPAQYALLQRLVAALLAGSFGATVPESVLLDARELMYRMTALAKRCVCAASRGVAVPTAVPLAPPRSSLPRGGVGVVVDGRRCRCCFCVSLAALPSSLLPPLILSLLLSSSLLPPLILSLLLPSSLLPPLILSSCSVCAARRPRLRHTSPSWSGCCSSCTTPRFDPLHGKLLLLLSHSARPS